MEGLEHKSEPLALRIFRRAGKVTGQADDGTTLEGRGIVSALRQETGEPGEKRHALGGLDRPLYRFVGWLPDGAGLVGGILAQGDKRYKILDLRPVVLGERQIGTRALLEKEQEAVAYGER